LRSLRESREILSSGGPAPCRTGQRALAIAAATLAGALSLVAAERALHLVALGHVDEDVATYWYAAQEFAHLHFREPFFYGQAYHHLGEALLAAPLVAVGAPVWVVPTLVSTLVGLTPWVLLAVVAWRRGLCALAVLFLAAPALMPAGYGVLLTRFFGMGLMLVTAALTIAELGRAPARWVVVGALVTLGVLSVPNALLLAAPVGVWLLLRARRGRRDGLLFAAGVGVGAVAWALGRWFYALHPSWALHPAPVPRLRWELLRDGLQHLPRHLTRVTPEILLHPAVPLVGLAALAVLAAVRRRATVALAAGATLSTFLVLLATERVHNATPSVFYSYERAFLGMPLATACVVLLAAIEGLIPRPRGRLPPILGAAVILGAAIWGLFQAGPELSREGAIPETVLDDARTPDLVRSCRSIESLALSTGADLVIFAVHRTGAYGCGAISYDRLTTLFPPYDRRTWLLLGEAHRTRDRLLLVDVEPSPTCRLVRTRVPGARCQAAGSNGVLVSDGPGSSIDFARWVGIPVRAF